MSKVENGFKRRDITAGRLPAKQKRLLTTEYEHVHDLCLEQMNALLTLTHTTHKRLIEEDSLHDPFVIHKK